MTCLRQIFLAAIALVSLSCTDDGETGVPVDIVFVKSGSFREHLLPVDGRHIVEISAATDVAITSTPIVMSSNRGLGVVPIDDDVEPYPFNATPRRSGPDGLDRRWWQHWAGVGRLHYYEALYASGRVAVARASQSGEGGYPILSSFEWCTFGICYPWSAAAVRGDIECYPAGERDPARKLPTSVCKTLHPKRHWNVVTRDPNCPEPNGCRAVFGVEE